MSAPTDRRRPRRPAPTADVPFWESKTLAEMNDQEWESLCDGCGKCCLISLEDEDTGALYLTDVACKLFDGATCQCSDYANRKSKVPDCVKLTPENVPTLDWLPRTCGYRLVSEGKPLFWWHPLVSGDPETVHASGASARDQTRPEGRLKIAGLMKRIREWPAPAEKPAGLTTTARKASARRRNRAD
jgi:uncharacterized protein